MVSPPNKLSTPVLATCHSGFEQKYRIPDYSVVGAELR
jgi:hypothetical protein